MVVGTGKVCHVFPEGPGFGACLTSIRPHRSDPEVTGWPRLRGRARAWPCTPSSPMFSLFSLSRLRTLSLAWTLMTHSASRVSDGEWGGTSGAGRQLVIGFVGRSAPVGRWKAGGDTAGSGRAASRGLHEGGRAVCPQCPALGCWKARCCRYLISWLSLRDPKSPVHGCPAKGRCRTPMRSQAPFPPR